MLKEPTSCKNVEEQIKVTTENPNLGNGELWVDVIKDNRVTTNVMPIEFVAPQIVDGEIKIQIKEKDIENEIKI